MRKLIVILSVLTFGLILHGCVGVAVQAVQYGAYAIDSMENVNVKARVSPNTTKEEIQNIKNVAVILKSNDKQETTKGFRMPMSLLGTADTKNMKKVMADNFTMEMFDLGFSVIEREQLDAIVAEQGLTVSGLMAPNNAKKVGELLGIDAFVMGNIIAENKIKRGLMSSSIDSVVTSSTMKIVNSKTGKVMMVVTLSYKHGQKPQEASKTMAKALKIEFDKIVNPETVNQSKN